jgi:hypothetical protein
VVPLYVARVKRLGAAFALGVLAVLPAALWAQDTANRAARAIDLAAAHAVVVDSVSVAASKWRSDLSRNPDDRYAALGLANLARLTYDTTADDALVRSRT